MIQEMIRFYFKKIISESHAHYLLVCRLKVYSENYRLNNLGWYIGHDEITGRNYYFNPFLSISQWEFPQETNEQIKEKKIKKILENINFKKMTSQRCESGSETGSTQSIVNGNDQIKNEINRRKNNEKEL